MRREVRRDFPRARGFLDGRRRAADEDARARRRFLRRRRVERPFDANRADVREEREARRRSRLQRVAHEMLIEIEHRREVRRREGCADQVRARRRVEAHAHRRAAAAAEECFRTLLAAAGRAGSRAACADGAASAPRRSATALRTRCAIAVTVRLRRAETAAANPVDQPQPLAIEQDLELLAGHGPESGRRHVVAEDRRHRDRVLPIGGEDVFDQDAATRPERQAFDVVVLRRVFRRAIHDQPRRRRLPDCEPADFSGRVHVRLDERRRDAKRAGDVVEPMRGIVGRQIDARIDVEREDVADRVGVLRPIQAMEAGRRRVSDRRAIQFVFEIRDEAVVGGFVRSAGVGGRHHAGAQLPHDQFPLVRVLADARRIKVVERQLPGRFLAGGLCALIVASDAVAIQ